MSSPYEGRPMHINSGSPVSKAFINITNMIGCFLIQLSFHQGSKVALNSDDAD